MHNGTLLKEAGPESLAFQQAAYTLTSADRTALASRVLADALADAQSCGSRLGFAFTSVNRALLHYHLGALGDAEADASSALSALAWEGWLVQVVGVGIYVETLLDKGDRASAAAVLEEYDLNGSLPESAQYQWVLSARGRLRLAQRDPSAVDDFLELERRRQAGHLTPTCDGNTCLALLMAGAQVEARRHAEANLDRARAWGAPSAVGAALRNLGVVQGGAAGVELLEQAVTVLQSSPARLQHARALIELGALLRRLGRRGEARHPLRHGLHLATRCGATLWAERALDEIRAAGGRPRRPAMLGHDALTATERRVATMARDGLTNRDIAQALFVTTRTVEGHLTHAYQKLGIRSRSQLGPALDTSTEAPRGRPDEIVSAGLSP
jgi:DNA-binding CsgD family transcriptional regulator